MFAKSWADALPKELHFVVAEQLGPEASLKELIIFEQECEENNVSFAPLFTAWLRSVGDAPCTWALWWSPKSASKELSFVRRHIPSR